jgi:mono/diheme cytochrome c family protein
MQVVKLLLVIAAIAMLGGGGFVYSGLFNVAADEPHSRPFLWVVEKTRERSIAVRAKALTVPPLDDPELIGSGGADYNEMCTGCHLKPGMADSELRTAMYPRPPDLTKVKRGDPAQTFWVIKHGIKMSGMPGWGATHDDQRMWAMVAFLQQLPRLTPDQYQILTARDDAEGGSGEHSDQGHEHTESQSGH